MGAKRTCDERYERVDPNLEVVCAVQQRQHRRAEVERGVPDLVRCQRVETRGVPYVTR